MKNMINKNIKLQINEIIIIIIIIFKLVYGAKLKLHNSLINLNILEPLCFKAILTE